MNQHDPSSSLKYLAISGLVVVFLLAAVAALAVVSLQQDRLSARYPGATTIAVHSNYSGLPRHYRWDDAYHTTEPFVKVYRWYSLRYETGAEARANAGCILLEGIQQRIVFQRQVTVLLCGTPTGQRIYVTRSTTLGTN